MSLVEARQTTWSDEAVDLTVHEEVAFAGTHAEAPDDTAIDLTAMGLEAVFASGGGDTLTSSYVAADATGLQSIDVYLDGDDVLFIDAADVASGPISGGGTGNDARHGGPAVVRRGTCNRPVNPGLRVLKGINPGARAGRRGHEGRSVPNRRRAAGYGRRTAGPCAASG